MWWKLKKLLDDEKIIVYAYSRETRDLDGRIVYDKKTRALNCQIPAANDTEADLRFFYPHLRRVIEKMGAPDEEFIAIG